jgi:hypothetical protein
LAWAQTTEGEWVVATDRSLLDTAGAVPWHAVERATWDAGRLTLSRLDGGAAQEWSFADDEVSLPVTVRERVQSSIVLAERVELGAGAAMITARRVPGSVDPAWTVIFDSGLDPADPALQAAATAEVERLRALL